MKDNWRDAYKTKTKKYQNSSFSLHMDIFSSSTDKEIQMNDSGPKLLSTDLILEEEN